MTKKTPDPAPKPAPDWERIELDYRAGILSLRELAAAHGITHGAINKRAKRDGWQRDLKAKIRARADELVSRAEVSTAVSSERLVTERVVVEANAMKIAEVLGGQKATANRLHRHGETLLAELEAQAADVGALQQLGEHMRAPDDNGSDRLNDLYQKIISTPQRVDAAKKVAEMLKTAIGLQRQAYGLADGDAGPAGGADEATPTMTPADAYMRLVKGQ